MHDRNAAVVLATSPFPGSVRLLLPLRVDRVVSRAEVEVQFERLASLAVLVLIATELFLEGVLHLLHEIILEHLGEGVRPKFLIGPNESLDL